MEDFPDNVSFHSSNSQEEDRENKLKEREQQNRGDFRDDVSVRSSGSRIARNVPLPEDDNMSMRSARTSRPPRNDDRDDVQSVRSSRTARPGPGRDSGPDETRSMAFHVSSRPSPQDWDDNASVSSSLTTKNRKNLSIRDPPGNPSARNEDAMSMASHRTSRHARNNDLDDVRSVRSSRTARGPTNYLPPDARTVCDDASMIGSPRPRFLR